MAHRYSSASGASEQGDSFELLYGPRVESLGGMTVVNPGESKSISRLPAKRLPLRSTTRVVRHLFWVGLAAVTIIIGLSVLASQLHNFLPDTSFFELNSPISCDLYSRSAQSGAFEGAFTINLRGKSHLTFTQAKAIDVIWQLFIGAGGRFLMAWIAYLVFMDGLTRLMEDKPVAYDLYASLTFSTTSLFAMWYGFKAIIFTKGWRSKAFMLWFTLSTIYMLGFPTLMSATAGYLTPSTSGYNMTDGTFLTPNSEELHTCWNVPSGALIGANNGSVFVGPPTYQWDAMSYYGYSGASYDKRELRNVPDAKSLYPQFYDLYYSSLESTAIYNATNSTQPPIDPLTGYISMSDSNFTTNITIEGHQYFFHNTYFDEGFDYSAAYCYNNKTIPNLKDLAECLPENYFVWGFSSLLVYIVLCLQIVWTFSMYLVWLDANIYSALCRSGRRTRGPFRAAADLSEAIGELLGGETCAYTEDELARELSKQPGIRYYSTDDVHKGDISHIGLSSRPKGKVKYNSTKLYGHMEWLNDR